MKKIQSGKRTRRDWLKLGGKAVALTSLSGCDRLVPIGQSTVKLGLLHSQTGSMAISETSLRDAGLLAIEEINAAGGVLGYPIEPLVEDGRSRFLDEFPKKARKLLSDEKVFALFGCWTSSSRKAVLPLLEELNGLLFYPVQYEGNESSKNIVYTGATPNQQILPAIDWLLSEAGGSRKRFFLIGSDYVFPRTANFIVTKYLGSLGIDVVGTTYMPFGHRDFKSAVQAIKKSDADVILNTINGDSNIGFYSALAEQGITADKVPVVATSVGEDELRSLLPTHVQGHYSAWTYFQSLNNPQNKRFVELWKREFGNDRVTDDPIEAAYTQIYLWKLAAEKAGSFEAEKVRKALGRVTDFEAPSGKVKFDPKTQHMFKRFRLGRVRGDRQFDIVHESPDWIAPFPYPQIAFPGWKCDWTQDGITQGEPVKI